MLVVDAIREVLKIRFKEHLCENRAPLHFAGPNYTPDFGSAYALRKRFKKEQDWRRSYYLDTVLQGAAEDFVSNHVEADDAGAVRCRHCRQPVTGRPSCARCPCPCPTTKLPGLWALEVPCWSCLWSHWSLTPPAQRQLHGHVCGLRCV